MENHKSVRNFLWLNHGHRIGQLYGDDGEMQCNHRDCMTDFKRLNIFKLLTRFKITPIAEHDRLIQDIQEKDKEIERLEKESEEWEDLYRSVT